MRWLWLSSPAVVLVGFVASVICVGQWIVSVVRGVHRMAHAAEGRQRARIWVAMASLGVVVGTSFLSWPAVVVGAAKAGTGGVPGELYPVIVNGLAAVCALVLLLDAVDGRRFSLLPCCMLVGGLGFAAFAYIALGGAPSWERYVVASAPGVVMAMLLVVMFGSAHRALSRSASARRPA
jgi:hypothetical protein